MRHDFPDRTKTKGNPTDLLGGLLRFLAIGWGLGLRGRGTDLDSGTSTSGPIGFELGVRSERACTREPLRSRWSLFAKQVSPLTPFPKAAECVVAENPGLKLDEFVQRRDRLRHDWPK
jgi:hypothetical protein